MSLIMLRDDVTPMTVTRMHATAMTASTMPIIRVTRLFRAPITAAFPPMEDIRQDSLLYSLSNENT